MLNQFIASRFGISLTQGHKLVQIFFLAVSIFCFSVLGLIIGISLFLNRAGTEYLPLSYIIMGLCSLPIYTWLSKVVDTISRPKLFRYLLILAIIVVILLRIFLVLDQLIIYYLIHIGCYLQWIVVTEVVFPSLIADYFTSLDWKKYTSFIRMAMALGGLLGGGLASLLSQKLTTENILFSLPIIYIIVFGQLVYLEHSERPLEDNNYSNLEFSENLGNLKTLKKIVKQYPIIIFLSSSTFLFIVLYTIAEFQYFTIYSQNFSQEALTSFLGIIRIVNNIIPFVILYLFTQPLIEKLGVIQMNLVYPLTSLLSFIGLAVNFNIQAAIYANINSDGLEDSINQPIHNLNYNAVPHYLLGRIRTISNGLFYSLGLAISGIILWFSEHFLTSLQITFLGIIFSILFIITRYLMGKSYLKSLLTMLKKGAVKLKDVRQGLTRLPSEYNREIDQLLISSDRQDQILGLQLASRVEFPSQFLPQVELLLKENNPAIRQGLISFFSLSNHPKINSYLRFQLGSKNEFNRLVALEALIASQNHLSDSEIKALIEDFNTEIQALACIAALDAGSSDQKIKNICEKVWHSDLNDTTRLAIIRGIKSTKNLQLIPLVERTLLNGNTEVIREGLSALAFLAKPGDFQLADLASKQITHLDPLVRAAAFELMGVICSPRLLLDVAIGLESPTLSVRLWATSALANYGESSLPVAKIYLFSSRLEVVESAIAAIGKVGTRKASEILYNFLKPDFQLFTQTEIWLQKLPENNPGWRWFKVLLKTFINVY
jgi:HEAT repeat protein/MFS family permease